MKRAIWITALVGVLLAGLVLCLFILQNSARTTQLSLDLYLAAWQFGEPVSVVALIFASMGIGVLVGLGIAVPRGRALRKKIRTLENQAALGGDTASWK